MRRSVGKVEKLVTELDAAKRLMQNKEPILLTTNENCNFWIDEDAELDPQKLRWSTAGEVCCGLMIKSHL